MELKLTLKKRWFDLMESGNKAFEVREPSKWIKSRLYNKDGIEKKFKTVRFTNGYGKDKPYFIANFESFTVWDLEPQEAYFSDGSFLTIAPGHIIIFFGEIIETTVIKQKPKLNPLQVAKVLSEQFYDLYEYSNKRFKTDNYLFALKFAGLLGWTVREHPNYSKNQFAYIVENINTLKKAKRYILPIRSLNELIEFKSNLKINYYEYLKSKLSCNQ